ncbi:MAG: hypothetical protein WA400_13375 [Silvibacterium sp.]
MPHQENLTTNGVVATPELHGPQTARCWFVVITNDKSGAEEYADAPQLSNRPRLVLVVAGKAAEVQDDNVSNLPALYGPSLICEQKFLA